MNSILSRICPSLMKSPDLVSYGFQQVRNTYKWVDWKMYRDVRRRKTAKEYAKTRVRIVSMKRNDILPIEIREDACLLMDKVPRTSALRQLTNRCVLTSRPRGLALRWRLSRIVFRDLADYNKLAGVQRAIWG